MDVILVAVILKNGHVYFDSNSNLAKIKKNMYNQTILCS